MKKTLFTIALAAVATASTYAQGFVLFQNTAAAGTHISTNSAVGGAATGQTFANAGTIGTTYYYALFYSTAATTVDGSSAAVAGNGNYAWQDSNWTLASSTYATTEGFAGDLATNTTSVGKLNSEAADPSNSGQTGIQTSSAANFVVVGWSANIGSTVAALETYMQDPSFLAWVGESAVSGTITPSGGGTNPSQGLFGSGEVEGFVLGETAVPEPGTLALAAIGGASLLALRRKK